MTEHDLITDFLFDGDGATVQRAKSTTGVTGRDVLTVEECENVASASDAR